MNTTLAVAKVLALLSVCILCIALTRVVITLNNNVNHIDQVVSDVDDTVKRTDLLVKESSYLVLQAGLTANEARKASVMEVATLTSLNIKVQTVLTDVDTFIRVTQSNETQTLQTTNDTIKQIQPVLTSATKALDESTIAIAELQVATGSINTLATDVSIPKTLDALQRSANESANSMQNVTAMTQDVRQSLHSYLHPTWVTSAINWLFRIAKVFAP